MVAVQGRNLQSFDWNGKSDPYLVLRLGEEEHKTTIKKKTLNPVWAEGCTFSLEQEHAARVLEVFVWDWVSFPSLAVSTSLISLSLSTSLISHT